MGAAPVAVSLDPHRLREFTHQDRAWQLCERIYQAMLKMGVTTTAVFDAGGPILAAELERLEHVECEHGMSCSCAIGTRHFWHQSFCEERELRLRGEAAVRVHRCKECGGEVQAVQTAMGQMFRCEPCHSDWFPAAVRVEE